MTAPDLLIGTGIDDTGLRRGLDSIIRQTERGMSEMQRAAERFQMDARALLPPDMASVAGGVGADAGRSLVAGLASSIGDLRDLAIDIGPTYEMRQQDLGALRELVAEQRELASATEGADREMRQLSDALRALDAGNMNAAHAALAGWTEEGTRGSVRLQAEWQREREAARQRAAEIKRAAAESANMARLEQDARRQARLELTHDIRTLGLYGRTVDGTSAKAVAAWRSEAAAIRAQAQELRLSREQMLRLEATIRTTENAFRRQELAAKRAATVGITPLVRTTGLFTEQGRQAANAALGLGFALQSVASNASNSEGKLRSALNAVSALGVAFGPKGLIVAGAAQATSAMVDMFRRARDEAEKTRKTFEEEMARLANAGDMLGVQKEMRELWQGTPGDKRNPLSGFAEGSIQDLQTQIDKLKELRALALEGRAPAGTNFWDAVYGSEKEQRELQARLDTQMQQYRQLEQLALNPPQLPRAITGLPEVRITGKTAKTLREEAEQAAREAQEAFNKFVRDSEATVIRLNVVQEMGGTHAEFMAAAREAQEAERAITAEIERRGGARAEDIRGIRELMDVQREIREVTSIPALLKVRTPEIIPLKPVIVPGEWNTGIMDLTRATEKIMLGSLAGITQKYDHALQALDFAKVSEDAQALREAEARFAAVRAEAERAAAQMAAFALSLPGGGVLAGPLNALIQKLRGTKKEAGDFTQSLRSIGNAVRGTLQIADAFGEVDDSIRQSVDGLAGMVAGIADARAEMDRLGAGAGIGDLFKSAAGLSSVVSILGGAAGLLGGLFQKSGPSPEEQAWVRALEGNEEQLHGLRLDLRAFGSSLRDATTTQRAAAGLDQVLRRGSSLDYLFDVDVWRDRMGTALADFGLTIYDLEAAAREYGITLVQDGKISTQALRELGDAARLTRENALALGKSFSAITNLETIRGDLFNLDGPAEAWRQAVEVGNRMLPAQVREQLAGLEIDTAAGRDAVSQWIRETFERAEAGDLADMLGLSGFQNIGEFFDWLVMLEQPLDDLRDAASEAAGALRNIPTGFKLDLRRFESMLGEVPQAITQPRPYIPPPPPTPSRAEKDRGEVRQRVDVQNTFHITIEGADKNADQLLDEVTEAARRRAQATYGTTANAYQVIR